jgi:hypothetical protein
VNIGIRMFKRIDPRAFGVFRIVFYLTFLYFYNKFFYVEYKSWFNPLYEQFFEPVSFYKLFSYDYFTYFNIDHLHLIWNISLLFAAAGFLYPISSVLSFLCLLVMVGTSLNFGKIHHSQHLPVMILGVVACGLRPGSYSIDSLFYKKSKETTYWPLRAAQLYMCLIYFASGYQKLKNTGLDWIFSDNMQAIILTRPTVTSLGLWLANHNWLCQLIALVTVLAQFLSPLALLSWKFAVVVIPILFSLHIGTYLVLGNHGYFFPYNLCYLVWLPWEKIRDYFLYLGALFCHHFKFPNLLIKIFYQKILFPMLILLMKLRHGNRFHFHLRHSVLEKKFNVFNSDIDYSVVVEKGSEDKISDLMTDLIKISKAIPVLDYPEVYLEDEWQIKQHFKRSDELNFLWNLRKEGWLLGKSRSGKYETFKKNMALKAVQKIIYKKYSQSGIIDTCNFKFDNFSHIDLEKNLCVYSPYLELTNSTRVWEFSDKGLFEFISILPGEQLIHNLSDDMLLLKKEIWLNEYLTARAHIRLRSRLGESTAKTKLWLRELEESFQIVFKEPLFALIGKVHDYAMSL